MTGVMAGGPPGSPADHAVRRQGGSTARETAAALVAAYGHLAAATDKARWAEAATTRPQADGRGRALALAAARLAVLIDADPTQHDRLPYHNRQHYGEVVLAASALADIHQLPAGDTQLLLLAALAHDVVHDGHTSSGFRLESASVALVSPLLAAAGVDAPDRDRFAAMVLATEPAAGVRHAIAARRFHAEGGARPVAPAGALELDALADDARLSRLAALLCEADVLPSVGLTVAHGLVVQHRLALEWGRRLSPADKRAFVAGMIDCGVVGPFFAVNAAAALRELHTAVDATEAP